MSSVLETESYNYCALPLAAYATRPDQSKGRLLAEAESKHRTCFQRDRDRIIHASAFRRLKYKTQVFVYHEGDHYRTRLTHTLEVAQIARSLARALYVNEDLAEGVALSHDLGHTPFAHLGEYALQDCMSRYGGFEHNDQSLRILTLLERKYPNWPGLNLTWETLEGVLKHNGPYEHEDLSETVALLQDKTDLQLKSYASLEAQVAAIADDIAYNNHDIEDGLRAGLFTIEDMKLVPLLARLIEDVEKCHKNLAQRYLVQEVIRDMIGAMVEDDLTQTRINLENLNPQSPVDIRSAGKQLVHFSDKMHKDVELLRAFLFERMYRHYSINRIGFKVNQIIHDLFEAYMEAPDVLPTHWQQKLYAEKAFDDLQKRARHVCDYIAGMTDRFAMKEHASLYDLQMDVK